MAIQRQARDHGGIGSLKLLGAMDLPTAVRGAAGAAEGIDEMIHCLAAGARASFENPSRLHGLRVEAMFRAVMVALGEFDLLTDEDEGALYFDDRRGPLKLPDYRVVGHDGRQLLVEVKAVSPYQKPLLHSIPIAEVNALRRYGDLTGVPVAVAHYWAAVNLWTLIDLDCLHQRDGRCEVAIEDAIRFSDMSRFGDRSIGTVPPLALRLQVEQLGTRRQPDVASGVIRGAEFCAAGQSLTDSDELRIAWLLFRYGSWNVETPAEFDPRGRIKSYALEAKPVAGFEEVERQGFAIVGSLSSIYSAIFNEQTVDDHGAVRHLDYRSEPGEIGGLIPSDYFERSDRKLKLWVLAIEPTQPSHV